jgi:hypothetical protein
VEVDSGDDSRATRVVRLYAKGYRQTAVASRVGISRERVRQILDAHQIPKRTPDEQRERNYWLSIEGREGEIEAAFWAVRDFAEVARVTGIQRNFVERLMKDLWPDVDVFLEVDWGTTQVFSDVDLRQALRDAAAAPGMPSPITVSDYDDWAAGAPARPARPTIMGRFGGWRAALLSAGLPANVPHRRPGEFTADVCVEAMARCWRQTEAAPSLAEYSAWQKDHTGEPGADMIRSRLRTCTDAKLATYERVHGKYPPVGQDRSQSQPEPVSPLVGRAYRPRDFGEWHSPSDVFTVDPTLIEERVRSHFELEGQIAELALERGLVPISPTDSDPQFDVAWRTAHGLTVVEVKSATPDNLESQTRLGIGQILGYAEHLRDRGEQVRPALLIELPPAPIWAVVAARVGLVIANPGTMERLFAVHQGVRTDAGFSHLE